MSALISEKMNSALNRQVGNEFATSLQYVAVAAHFDEDGLPELAAHFYRQAEEERTHAMRFVKYVVDAGGRLELPAIERPASNFATAEEAVRLALEGEVEVTRQINQLVDLAQQEGDHLTENFLQWFVTEQLEEVSTADELHKVVKRAGESGLLHVEEYLARRGPVQDQAGQAGA
jgi:ferritin